MSEVSNLSVTSEPLFEPVSVQLHTSLGQKGRVNFSAKLQLFRPQKLSEAYRTELLEVNDIFADSPEVFLFRVDTCIGDFDFILQVCLMSTLILFYQNCSLNLYSFII